MRKTFLLSALIFSAALLCLSLPPQASTETEQRVQPAAPAGARRAFLPAEGQGLLAKASSTAGLGESPSTLPGQTLRIESGNLAHATSLSPEMLAAEPAQASASACLNANCGVSFDDLFVGVDMSNYYDQIKFASPGGGGVFTVRNTFPPAPNQSTYVQARSLPNCIASGREGISIIFPHPVNNLNFFIASVDSTGIVAQVEYFQNGVFAGRIPVQSSSIQTPIPINFAAQGITRITRVNVVNIVDPLGFSYDDFSFNQILPERPRNIRASLTGPQQVTVNWDPSADATSYEIWRSRTRGGGFSVVGTSTTTSFVDSAVEPGTEYFYALFAINHAGRSGFSDEVGVSTPLPAPTGLQATTFPNQPEVYDRVLLVWHTTPNVTEYIIKRSKTSGGGYEVVSRFLNTTIDLALNTFHRVPELDTTYFYVVSAVRNGIESPNSNEVAVTLEQTCGVKTLTPKPQPVQVQHFSWTMKAEVTDRDGLVLRDVALNGRYMSAMMSVPYVNAFVKDKDGFLRIIRIELTPDNPNPTQIDPNRVRSRLTYFNPNWTDSDSAGRMLKGVYAQYIVDHLFPGSVSCLTIKQKYLFGFNEDGGCELSSTLDCARFYPKVEYEFDGRGKETLEAITIPQRLHHKVENNAGSTFGLFRDCDTLPIIHPGPPPVVLPTCKPVSANPIESLVFEEKLVPVLKERRDLVVWRGHDQKAWDNIHQTYNDAVGEPAPADIGPVIERLFLQFGGCPECFHSHWRWGTQSAKASEVLAALLGRPGFGSGNLIGFQGKNTNQDLEVAIVRYRGSAEETHPLDYKTLVNSETLWRQESIPNPLVPLIPIVVTAKEEAVVWQVTTGRNPAGSTFEYGGFFNWNLGSRSSVIQPRQTPAAAASGPASSIETAVDLPTSVTYEYVYQEGPTTVSSLDPNIVGPLPPGYAHFNNAGYEIQTEAVASGKVVVTFNVPSAASQAAFNNLRILHAERDPLNPERAVWADRTILAPDPQGPDFAAKTIRARTEHLGLFVIASLTNQPIITKSADISVSVRDSADPVLVGSDLTYTIDINNLGPDAATHFGMVGRLSPDVLFVSATTAQGECDFHEGAVYCHFHQLNGGASATVNVVVKPIEKSRNRFPAEGQALDFSVYAASTNQADSNRGNNAAQETTRALPDSNAPPAVRIISPVDGASLTGPTHVTVTAEASDSDGAISKVEFFGDGVLIGAGAPVGANQYRINWNNVGFGPRSIYALATDNGGKPGISDTTVILINGSAAVNITSPAPGSFLSPNSNLTITATASHPSGSIGKVEFFANERLIGETTTASGGQYSLTWNNVPRGVYDLRAIATDNSGFMSFSRSVKVFVMEQTGVRITAPGEATTFPALANVNITAEITNTAAVTPSKVEFFANGAPIGEGSPTSATQYSLTWLLPPDGFYSLTAVATDPTGLQWTSQPVNIAVNTPGLIPVDFVWFDDALPPGAVPASNNDGWHWVDSNPAPVLGSKSHQSEIVDGLHLHAFQDATLKLPINNGDKLYTYVFLHPGYVPDYIMLEWKDETNWEHRAYWSKDGLPRIGAGAEGTAARRLMGQLPEHSRWVKLEVPAELVGLNGKVVNGMSFFQFGGRATWDRAGKTNGVPPPPSPSNEVVWFDDAPPQGATLGMFHDDWFWVPPTTPRGCPVSTPQPFSGQRAHQTFYNCDSTDNLISRAHYFTNAAEKMEVKHGDTLFAYAYLDPVTPPEQLILGWNDGTRWYNAYWGTSHLLAGLPGTEGMRYMGPTPRSGQWVRLEVPAAYVGLDGKTVSGMYFGMSRAAGNRHGLVTWDKAGRTPQLPQAAPFPLYATTPVYRYFRSDSGYFFQLTPFNGAGAQPDIKWYVHANQAPGTRPFYRYRSVNSRHYFYSWRGVPDSRGFLTNSIEWQLDTEGGNNGIAFYIYPTGKRPPGAVDLHRFFNGKGYFYTINRFDPAANGMTYEEVDGYVFGSLPVLSPVPNQIDSPSLFVRQHYKDFLNREPDAAGLDFWISNITKCATERPPGQTLESCVEGQRVNVSAAFFLSIEFQETGYLVYRLYNAALNRNNGLLRFDEFQRDAQRVASGVIVGTQGWQQTLESNKVAFISEFVTRPEFVELYPTGLTPEQYVDALYAHARVTPDAAERQQAISEFAGAGTSADTFARARVLRKLAEGATLHQRELNRAFVLMQYFGYLRRNPDDPPDSNLDGYNFWLKKLNDFNGNFVQAEMVKAFIVSIEYRGRFGPPVLAHTSNIMSAASATAEAGAVSLTFSNVAGDGLVNSTHVYPASLAPPPGGYVFYDNLAWDVTTTSGVSGPVTLKVNLAGTINDPATFANLRVLHLENGQWVDRTTLAPDFNNRTISAGVGTLSPIAVARLDSAAQPPVVNLTSPFSGQSFTAPTDITIEANAWSASGTVAKVEFLQGGVVLGEDTEAPYSFTWRNVPAGVHPITARATDSNGLSSTTSGIKISVNDLPAVFIATPAQNAVFDYPASITINAYAGDSDGISQVEFFQGTTSLGVDTTAPYGVTWSNVGLGVHRLTAVATDNRNTAMTSPPVEVTVRNAPPTVAITSPAAGSLLGNAPATVTINAEAADSQGIRQVEFFRDGVSLGVDATAPYSFNWSGAAAGSYVLTAKATDNLNEVATSQPVGVTIGNAPPSVSITAPADGVSYDNPASITVQAVAADHEGVRKVEFFQGATRLGEDTAAPYSFNWANVPAGTYSLTAKATDNLDAVTTSSPVAVTVRGPLFTLFSDNFDDNSLDPARWAIMTPGAQTLVFERNQRLELIPPNAAAVTDYNGIASVATIDMTNARATVELPQHAPGYGHESHFQLVDPDTGHYVRFDVGGYGLSLQDSATGYGGRTVIASYTVAQYRYWRLRHDPATDRLLWESSADNSSWAALRSIARTFAITNMQVRLVAGHSAGVDSPPGTTVFDNLRVESAVANTAPSVSITAPAAGTVFNAPASVNVTASASDGDGSVRRVEFFQGSTSLGADTTAPYSLAWNNVAAGSYTLTARATDNRGGITTSAPVGVTVNAAPAVAMTMPAGGAAYTAPATITVGATAEDADGTISKVEFLQNGVLLATDTASPYSHTWSGVAAGSYALTARATDNRGAVSTSAAVNVAVNAPNAAPSVSITSPPGGALYDAPATVNLQASASDSDGSITGVEFFRNGVSLGTDTAAPYSFNWTNVPAGTYSLTAKATDNLGAATMSAAVNITVASQPSPPRADNIGVYTGNTFHLRVSNTSGPPHVSQVYGVAGWTPVVGDWDGNGTATLGVFVPEASQQGSPGQSLFHLSNRLDSTLSDTAVVFGLPGDKPIAGDWDGNGTVTIGVYRPSDYTFYLRNSNTAGPADAVVTFTAYSGETPVAGDWDGDGIDTVGMHNSANATFYLRNANTSGPLNVTVGFGNFGDIPVVGD